MADLSNDGREPGWIDPEIKQLPSERQSRRTKRKLVVALAAAILAHVLLLSGCIAFLALLIPFRLEPPPPPVREAMPTFAVPSPKKPEPQPPPETNQISDVNAVAESPGPGPKQAHGDRIPREEGVPEPPPPRQAPPPEPPREQVAEKKPEPEMEPVRESDDARRERLAQALRSLGTPSNDWSESLKKGDGADGSSGLGYDWGGTDFQIESKADVDWGPWSRRVQVIVKGNWYDIMPVAARVGMKGIVRVRFVVHRDGRLTDYELLETSGLPPLDDAVHTALVDLSNPLPPLPLREFDEDTIRITYMFVYNLSDEREMRAWQRERWREQRNGGI